MLICKYLVYARLTSSCDGKGAVDRNRVIQALALVLRVFLAHVVFAVKMLEKNGCRRLAVETPQEVYLARTSDRFNWL